MSKALERSENTDKIRNYHELFNRLQKYAKAPCVQLEVLGSFEVEQTQYPMCMVHLGNPDAGKVRAVLSAGIHGDEPAGVEAAMRFIEHIARDQALLERWYFLVFPCDNPYGWEHGTRENYYGQDLNRVFNAYPPQPEVQLITRGIKGRRFDLDYEMHEDYESDGFYLYESDADSAASIGEAIVQEVASFGYKVNLSDSIDGQRAVNGVIKPDMDDSRDAQIPKAHLVFKETGAKVIMMETPSTYLPMDQRVHIHLLGLEAALKLMDGRKPDSHNLLQSSNRCDPDPGLS